VSALGFIPARMGSSRFPGKPLAPIAGRPMLEHCYRGASQSELLDEVLIATCDKEIEQWAQSVGIGCVMTSPDHVRATDRVVEAALQFDDADAIVLIQGDEPMVTGEMVDLSLQPVVDGDAGCTNLMKRIETVEEFESPNTIKVVADLKGDTLYMSRGAVPSAAQAGFDGLEAFKQVCIFGFDRPTLLEFSELEPTPLEVVESIDMLRYIEHGRPVRLVETAVDTHAVDVPDDIRLVEQLLEASSR
jgi:3-deoxy-manno-octulosonate cytidylyltransferase (CMP-KDO synthetase)